MKPVVLVVDDDTAICALLQDVLSEHVFTVSVSHTGQEAISRIEGEPDIALVVLDMMLPDTNGLRVLQQIQKLRPALPVVMLTGMGSESDVVGGLEMGADDYICKPFTPRVVVARLKACCDGLARWRLMRRKTPGCHSMAGISIPFAANCIVRYNNMSS